MFKNKNTSQFIKKNKQSVYSVVTVYKVHSNFLSKCTAACIFEIARVRYILLLLGTLAIRNAAPEIFAESRWIDVIFYVMLRHDL